MPRSRPVLALVPAPSVHGAAARLTRSPAARIAALALLALVASAAVPHDRAESGTPLHVPVNRFEFVARGDAAPAAMPLAVHNGGTVPLTGVRLTRLAYAGQARGTAWLVAVPRQSTVAPDELATVATLCVDAAGLPAGTYHATAVVAAREVPEPVAIRITLVVTDARARRAASGCGPAVTKAPGRS